MRRLAPRKGPHRTAAPRTLSSTSTPPPQRPRGAVGASPACSVRHERPDVPRAAVARRLRAPADDPRRPFLLDALAQQVTDVHPKGLDIRTSECPLNPFLDQLAVLLLRTSPWEGVQGGSPPYVRMYVRPRRERRGSISSRAYKNGTASLIEAIECLHRSWAPSECRSCRPSRRRRQR